VRHPGGNAGEGIVRLQDHHQFQAAVLKPSPNQHGLAAPRMERIVDPPLRRVFMGSMSPFREATGPLADCRSCGRSAPPWCGVSNACRRRSCPSGALDPAMHDARVLARCHMRLIMESARKDVGASVCRSRVQPVLQRGASLLRDFELNRTAGLALDDCRPVSHVSARLRCHRPEG
jgi:hypothetical protein